MEELKQTTEVKKGIYLCYTGNEYRVLFTALDSRDHKTEVVVYQSVADEQIWVRAKEEFLGEKEIDGEKKPRFTFSREEEEESWEHKYKRALADYQNLLKATVKDKEDFAKYALTDFLHNVLPVYDHLKLSMSGLSEAEGKNPWVEGVRHVLKQFKDVLAQHGIEEISTVGEKFDHHTMDALDGNGETVKQEIMPGYKLNGKVIRPAKVIVE
ncbi:MAG: nucleotide exchange factor GrpE [Patescibacteria group bacterium]